MSFVARTQLSAALLRHISVEGPLRLNAAARLLSYAADEATLRDVSAVQATLEDALDGAQYIRDSAQQALLETDPSGREPADTYLARYQTAVRDDLDSALSKYEQLLQAQGEQAMQDLDRGRDFQLLKAAAESMRLRDTLNASLERTSEKLRRNWAECVR